MSNEKTEKQVQRTEKTAMKNEAFSALKDFVLNSKNNEEAIKALTIVKPSLFGIVGAVGGTGKGSTWKSTS